MSTQKYHEYELYELAQKQKVPERIILKETQNEYKQREAIPGLKLLDGFYLVI